MQFEDVRLRSSILHAFPFNSEKKRGGVAVMSVMFSSPLCQGFFVIIRTCPNFFFSPVTFSI